MRNIATTVLALFCLLGTVALATAAPNGMGGSDGPSIASPSSQTVIFHYVPGAVGNRFQCLDAWAAGCKLRHAPPAPPFASGSITVPGIVATGAVFAQLYWVVLADVEQLPTETFNGSALVREPLGVTASPCWAEANAYAYRADVSGLLVPGLNTLGGFPDSGLFNVAPETEGASLVVVHTTNGVDKEIIVTAGNDLVELGGVNPADLILPVVEPDGTGAELTFIVGDGQSAGDEAYWNGAALDAGDAFLGIDPGPGVGYWDTVEFGVFTAGPNTASVGSNAPLFDCLNWVGTLLKVKSGGCETVPAEPRTWGGVKELFR